MKRLTPAEERIVRSLLDHDPRLRRTLEEQQETGILLGVHGDAFDVLGISAQPERVRRAEPAYPDLTNRARVDRRPAPAQGLSRVQRSIIEGARQMQRDAIKRGFQEAREATQITRDVDGKPLDGVFRVSRDGRVQRVSGGR